LGIGVASVVGLLGLLVYKQESIIYLPRKYSDNPEFYEHVKKRLRFTELKFNTSQGAQLAHFVPGASALSTSINPIKDNPRHLWVLFNGNAGLGLDYFDFIGRFYASSSGTPLMDTSFLLIDYPGYGGRSEGKPAPDAIVDQTNAAVRALANHLQLSTQELPNRISINVFGQSLGAAAALRWSAHVTDSSSPDFLPLSRIICVAPFTSLAAMAKEFLGMLLPSPLAPYLVRHDWDNQAALNRIASNVINNAKSNRPFFPPLSIIHGDRDSIVPEKMGRSLAETTRALYPNWVVSYERIPGGDHNGITQTAFASIFASMVRTYPTPHL